MTTYSITVNPAVSTITPTSLPGGNVGSHYAQTVTAVGGSGLHYTFTNPSPVDGLTFTDNGNGTDTIGGTPTSTGPVSFSITVTDGLGRQFTQNYTVNINSGENLRRSTRTTPTWAASSPRSPRPPTPTAP